MNIRMNTSAGSQCHRSVPRSHRRPIMLEHIFQRSLPTVRFSQKFPVRTLRNRLDDEYVNDAPEQRSGTKVHFPEVPASLPPLLLSRQPSQPRLLHQILSISRGDQVGKPIRHRIYSHVDVYALRGQIICTFLFGTPADSSERAARINCRGLASQARLLRLRERPAPLCFLSFGTHLSCTPACRPLGSSQVTARLTDWLAD
jgi:hypothetical protein